VRYGVPQVRGVDGGELKAFRRQVQGRSEALEQLAVEMYARGCSTRDIEDTFRGEDGLQGATPRRPQSRREQPRGLARLLQERSSELGSGSEHEADAKKHRRRAGWLDSLFTATSAVCVTGLIVVDTATYFTPAGQAFLLLLIQLGGRGRAPRTAEPVGLRRRPRVLRHSPR
jgi:hypothetical protein